MLLWFVIISICVRIIKGLPAANEPDVGYFHHITDFHLDLEYTPGGDPKSSCHKSTNGNYYPEVGPFAYYGNCDPGTRLIDSAVETMKNVLPNPDFILWTGDSFAHIKTDHSNESQLIRTVKYTTDAIRGAFPDTLIYPCWGNNDYYPRELLPDHNNPIYDEMTAMWKSLIWPEENIKAPDTMLNAAYYSKFINRYNLKLLTLNTFLYCPKDKVNMTFPEDPGHQMEWLEQELEAARAGSYKVIISSHIAPGTNGRHRDSKHDMEDGFNRKFLNLTASFGDVISAMFFGHFHIDTFRVVPSNGILPSIPIFIAPAVTAWTSRNNPGIRIVKYDRKTGRVLDFEQHWMNLEASNAQNRAIWAKEYTFSRTYGYHNLSGEALNDLMTRLESNDTLFQTFYRNIWTQHKQENCTGVCRNVILCGMKYMEYDQWTECLNQPVPTKSFLSTTTSGGTVSSSEISLLTGFLLIISRM